ncbi:mechanosensitive ion channel family protein [Microbacterium imperiale]|uniref:Mechanosensitive ion channel protein MscS n=1 Tax=Microbacterium imperiale TaxID=33884 RepID=A0A9W6HJJ6_9MICO|nr:mechanosensitive ion channel domain-containing protein [Microbacterium imperiale]MBP2421702.1 small-conductance mechanosensitive channel [Microbacterium imperiale]MDS0199196.1 mechanosensitive ion channel family protein [Microbacterium imperiale]BFE42044.1 mechanosensitive ion channel [Microbacterium imperiale]GLJ80997.1 mechanosensitive ion channel protein MscS [Microbacterium imperiale]
MWDGWMEFGIAVLVGLTGAAVIAVVAAIALRIAGRRHRWPEVLSRRSRTPFRVLLLAIVLWAAVSAAYPDEQWRAIIGQLLTILIIGASTWLLASLVIVVTDVALGRYRIDVPDNRVARRIRTQMLIVRRLAVAIIIVIGIGAVLLTFDSVRAVGASVLASAGIASVVAGLAAQSVLGNVFAGLQIVFSDALRVDDVVVADGEWGRVGEITLSYVVLDLWDDRRLVLPCTYFTTTPFENWTRRGSELLGAVEMDLDWNVSPTAMRAHLRGVLEQTELWDRRTSVLQVTDAVAGYVRVRILVTAKDAPTLFDLRCLVREAMVTWVQRTMPQAVPVQRVMMTDATASGSGADHRITHDPTPTNDGLFTGSAEAERRASTFTNAIPVVTVGEPPERRD